jgi:5-methylcytosine-specific restriction endonuclease McrA
LRKKYKRIRDAVFKRDQERCVYCDILVRRETGLFGECYSDTATMDHVIEKHKGGPWTMDNLVLACSLCNRKREKLKKTSAEFKEWRQIPRNRRPALNVDVKPLGGLNGLHD